MGLVHRALIACGIGFMRAAVFAAASVPTAVVTILFGWCVRVLCARWVGAVRGFADTARIINGRVTTVTIGTAKHYSWRSMHGLLVVREKGFAIAIAFTRAHRHALMARHATGTFCVRLFPGLA